MFQRWDDKTNREGVLPTVTIGAMSELQVTVDLLGNGWDVYRSVCQAARCDLVAVKDGRVLRIEVRSGKRNTLGNIAVCKPPATHQFTTFAIVLEDGEIVYRGDEVP